jgi:AcrR family transcriptional regulator
MMMYRNGVASTGLDDVLAAAGCGKSQLYRYFEDRSDLVRAVIAGLAGQLRVPGDVVVR